jgi:hypothetical protein
MGTGLGQKWWRWSSNPPALMGPRWGGGDKNDQLEKIVPSQHLLGKQAAGFRCETRPEGL